MAGLYASACGGSVENATATGSGGTASATSAASGTNTEQRQAADKPFAAGGNIQMDLAGGEYQVKPAADDHVRVSMGGNVGDARVALMTIGTQANLKVTDTPHNNFHAVIEVPKTANLVVRLSGGDLTIGAIAGNKDIDAYAGDIKIAVGDPADYAKVDAAVKAGDIHADPFGGSKSGVLQHFEWSGSGKYTLHVNLGAGNLTLRPQ